MSATTTTTTTRSLCTCGCGTPVNKANSHYKPGHDARHAGIVARDILAERGTIDALPSQALRAKAVAMVERIQAKAEAKATAVKSVEPVKVGRWTYPAMRKGAVLLRNTKRDGSGEWVAV